MNKKIKILLKLLLIGILLFLIVLFPSRSVGCEAYPILKDEKANCEGLLIPLEMEKWQREEREYNKKLILNYKDQLISYKQLSTNQEDQITKSVELGQTLSKELENRKAQNWLFAGGGVLLGILVMSLTK